MNWLRPPLKSLHRLHRDRWGASYSISVVLVLPFFVGLMVAYFEMVLLLNSKLALTTALQTASHTTRAWYAHRDQLASDRREIDEVVRQAMLRSMVPFASTKQLEGRTANPQLINLYQQLGSSQSAARRFAGKVDYIDEALRLRLTEHWNNGPGLLIQAEYDSPLWTPFFGRVWGNGSNATGEFRTITAVSWVPLSESELQQTNLGIQYAPAQVTSWR